MKNTEKQSSSQPEVSSSEKENVHLFLEEISKFISRKKKKEQKKQQIQKPLSLQNQIKLSEKSY